MWKTNDSIKRVELRDCPIRYNINNYIVNVSSLCAFASSSGA